MLLLPERGGKGVDVKSYKFQVASSKFEDTPAAFNFELATWNL
jgi:hypothetical protein